MNSKEYILQTPEYSWAYDSEREYNGNDNYYGGGKTLRFPPLLQYSRGIRYISYNYFKNGDYNKGISILLEHQNFIDNLINKTDADLIYFVVNIQLSKINLESIEYFLSNYELSKELKNEIRISIENKIDKGLIINTLKREHIINRTIFQYLYDSSFETNDGLFSYVKGVIEISLFYSVEESELISDIMRYDLMNNKGEKYDFKCSTNLNNYIGRTIICNYGILYQKQFQNEQDLINIRQSILQKLK